MQELCWDTRMAAAWQGHGDGALGGRGVGRQERWSQGEVEACKAARRQALALSSVAVSNSRILPTPGTLKLLAVPFSSTSASLRSHRSSCHYQCHVSLSAAPALQDYDNPEASSLVTLTRPLWSLLHSFSSFASLVSP